MTADSQNVVAVIEAVTPEQVARANEAMTTLRELIHQYFGVQPSPVFQLTKENPQAVVPADM